MPNSLSDEQVRSYNDNGYLFPIGVFDAVEIAELRGRFETLVAREGGQLSRGRRTRARTC